MTSMLPIIEELADAPDHKARARWLLEVPLAVIIRDQVTIHRLLSAAGFLEGLAYFAAEIAALSATRGRDGLAPNTIRMTREYARIGIQVIARGAEEGSGFMIKIVRDSNANFLGGFKKRPTRHVRGRLADQNVGACLHGKGVSRPVYYRPSLTQQCGGSSRRRDTFNNTCIRQTDKHRFTPRTDIHGEPQLRDAAQTLRQLNSSGRELVNTRLAQRAPSWGVE